MKAAKSKEPRAHGKLGPEEIPGALQAAATDLRQLGPWSAVGQGGSCSTFTSC